MEDLPSIVPGLAALAGPEAVEGLERGEAFVVTIDDIPIRVTYTSGTTPTVFLSTPYAPRETPAGATGYRDANVGRVKAPRPMFIELIPETEDERRAKREGVSREVQTGDAEFDRAAYVDTPSDEPIATRVLGSAKLRRAVQLLLGDGFRKIEIDDDRGNIAMQRGNSTAGKADAATIARAIATIAAEVPTIDKAGTFLDRVWPDVAMTALRFGVPTLVITAYIVAPFVWVTAGAMAGGALGGGAGALVARTQRGKSSSHWHVRAAKLMSIFTGVLLGTLGVLVHTGDVAVPLAIGIVVPASIAIARAGRD